MLNEKLYQKMNRYQRKIKKYKHRIMKKLEVKSKVELFMMGNSYLKLPY